MNTHFLNFPGSNNDARAIRGPMFDIVLYEQITSTRFIVRYIVNPASIARTVRRLVKRLLDITALPNPFYPAKKSGGTFYASTTAPTLFDKPRIAGAGRTEFGTARDGAADLPIVKGSARDTGDDADGTPIGAGSNVARPRDRIIKPKCGWEMSYDQEGLCNHCRGEWVEFARPAQCVTIRTDLARDGARIAAEWAERALERRIRDLTECGVSFGWIVR